MCSRNVPELSSVIQYHLLGFLSSWRHNCKTHIRTRRSRWHVFFFEREKNETNGVQLSVFASDLQRKDLCEEGDLCPLEKGDALLCIRDFFVNYVGLFVNEFVNFVTYLGLFQKMTPFLF